MTINLCHNMCEKLGFGCETLAVGAGGIVALDTPFGFSDGTPFVIYAEPLGGGMVRFFDAGETLFHAMGRGIRSFHSRKYQSIKSTVARHDVIVSETGEIEAYIPEAKTPIGFARFISALLAIADWEDENAGLDLGDKESRLVEEARLYLTAIHPDLPAVKSNFRARGLSGREYGFHLMQGDAQIDAITSHPAAAASELYKLVDLRGKTLTADTKIIVVIDDRVSIDQADKEAAVLGQYAETWPMRHLINTASANSPIKH
jgi:hypothetical protein